MTDAREIAGRLTKAQVALLLEDSPRAVETYKPAVKLVALGLLEAVQGKWGNTYFRHTELGLRVRAILQEKNDG